MDSLDTVVLTLREVEVIYGTNNTINILNENLKINSLLQLFISFMRKNGYYYSSKPNGSPNS